MLKTNVPGFVKDPRTGAVLNTDDGAFRRILAARRDRKERERTEMELKELRALVSSLSERIASGEK